MAKASGVTLEIDFAKIPAFDRAVEMLAAGHTCGGGNANAKRAQPHVDWRVQLAPEHVDLLHDPQTSGPLLLSLPADRAGDAVAALHAAGLARAATIGRVDVDSGKALRVL
jgi:selenide,water dikinase